MKTGTRWLFARFFCVASIFMLSIPTPISTTATVTETDPFQKLLEQASTDLLIAQLHLEDEQHAIDISSTQVMSDTARIDVDLHTVVPEFGTITEQIHVFALHDGERILQIFQEPSLEFLQYAEDLSSRILPLERLQFWKDLHQKEVALQAGSMTDNTYKLPFTGGTQNSVNQDFNKHFDFGGAGWIVRAARGGEAINSIDSHGAYHTRIRHVDGTYGWYLHFRANSWFRGTVGSSYMVYQGDCLALTGSTGLSDGAHLHFNVSTKQNNDPGCDIDTGCDPPYWLTVSFAEGTILTGGLPTPYSQNSSAACGSSSCCGCGTVAANKTSTTSTAATRSVFSSDPASNGASLRWPQAISKLFIVATSPNALAVPSIPPTNIASVTPINLNEALTAPPPSEDLAIAVARASVDPLRVPPLSSSYAIPKGVFGSSGGPKLSTSYQLQGTSGQTTGTGVRVSDSYRLRSGYWNELACPQAELAAAPDISAAGTAVTLTWGAVAGASSYRIYRGVEPYFPLGTPYDTTTGVTWMDPSGAGDLLVNHTYVIKAVNACSESSVLYRVAEYDFALTPGN